MFWSPFGWNGASQNRVSERERPNAPTPYESANRLAITNYYAPHGALSPMQYYAWFANRHRALYGITERATAEIALTCREHAQHNPRAYMRDREMTLEDYLASPMLSTPFRLLDCCLETDGACALIISSADRAADMPHQPVRIKGAASGIAAPPTTYPAARSS